MGIPLLTSGGDCYWKWDHSNMLYQPTQCCQLHWLGWYWVSYSQSALLVLSNPITHSEQITTKFPTRRKTQRTEVDILHIFRVLLPLNIRTQFYTPIHYDQLTAITSTNEYHQSSSNKAMTRYSSNGASRRLTHWKYEEASAKHFFKIKQNCSFWVFEVDSFWHLKHAKAIPSKTVQFASD